MKYILWGTRNGEENIIRVNGSEEQDNLQKAAAIKDILLKRKDFESIRIQKLDLQDNNINEMFIKTIN